MSWRWVSVQLNWLLNVYKFDGKQWSEFLGCFYLQYILKGFLLKEGFLHELLPPNALPLVHDIFEKIKPKNLRMDYHLRLFNRI